MRHPHDRAETRFNTDTGISKEDEERYKKLVSENDELQKLIAQVSIKISSWWIDVDDDNKLILSSEFSCSSQKEDKIRLLKQRLAEREQSGGSQPTNGAVNNSSSSNQLGINNQGKESIISSHGGIQLILPEPTSDFTTDSAVFGNGFSVSICTRSSEVEFSESYL